MPTILGTGVGLGNNATEAAKQAVAEAKKKLQNKSVDLAIVYCASNFDYREVVKGVRAATNQAPLIGCSTAGEFTESKVVKKSVTVGLISSGEMKFHLALATGLKKDPLAAVQQAVEKLPAKIDGYPHRSVLMFHDGLVGKGEETVVSAAAVLGPEVKFFGGSAGDDLKFASTSVFVNDQVETDAVAMCSIASKKPLITSVQHGHQPLSPKLKATKAVDNVLYEVDGRPAWEVWKEFTAKAAKEVGIEVAKLNNPTDVGSFLIRFELGLDTGDGRYKVRVPLSKNDDGSLNFACTITQGTVFRVMQSPKPEQIKSAQQAAEQAKAQLGNVKSSGILVFDCCCRGIILGDEFHKGVEAISKVFGKIPLLGFETYGEICMDPGQFSGYHNTTTVVVVLPE